MSIITDPTDPRLRYHAYRHPNYPNKIVVSRPADFGDIKPRTFRNAEFAASHLYAVSPHRYPICEPPEKEKAQKATPLGRTARDTLFETYDLARARDPKRRNLEGRTQS